MKLTQAENLRNGIERLRAFCREPGWDSYSSHPVTDETCDLALKLVEAIPDGWHVTATADGFIEFADERDGNYHTIEVHAMTGDQVDAT